MIYLGIDPGRRGAIAAIDQGGHLVRVDPTPLIEGDGRPAYDLAEIRRISQAHAIESRGQVYATIERQQALPARGFGKGGTGVGGTLANYARGEASGWAWMLTALGIPFGLVSPRTWQRTMLAGTGGDDTKQRSIVSAQRLWPAADLRRSVRARKLDDGVSDALLLAEFGRRVHQGGDIFAAAERGA